MIADQIWMVEDGSATPLADYEPRTENWNTQAGGYGFDRIVVRAATAADALAVAAAYDRGEAADVLDGAAAAVEWMADAQDTGAVVVIGDNGGGPGGALAWGLGATEEEAREDARANLGEQADEADEMATVVVSPQIAARIEAGEVDCDSLGIEVRVHDGRVIWAAVRS